MIVIVDNVKIIVTIEEPRYWAGELIQCVSLGENQLRLSVIYEQIVSKTKERVTLQTRVKGNCLPTEDRNVVHDDYNDRRRTNCIVDRKTMLLVHSDDSALVGG